jgi:ADP-ribosylglycohydrolase
MPLTLVDRIQGCLLGAAIGAELGFSRAVNPYGQTSHPEYYHFANPADVFDVPLDNAAAYQQDPTRVYGLSVAPFINAGVQAYLNKQGRATPEDFAAVFQDDAGIAGPAFSFDGMHTIQEILKEGMHPRISGMGNAPDGIVCAAMPAVGIYHFNDAEYAYLDGVELASIAQGRDGADWAGLCAGAIAAAFRPDTTPDKIIDITLKLAHQNNKELFYQTNRLARTGQQKAAGTDVDFAAWWMNDVEKGPVLNERNWFAYNPVAAVLPLLARYHGDPQKFFALLVSKPAASWFEILLGGRAVSAVIAGAIMGAMHGGQIFTEKWQTWAKPIAKPWFALADVVNKRVKQEADIIFSIERLMATREDGMTTLEDKVYGCILAGAIGNAMGSPVEGKFYTEIDAQYPKGVTGILNPGALESEDDNQMAMLLVETYLERDGLPVLARHFGQTWQERLNRDHFHALCMGRAYDLIRAGWDARITGHWSVTTGSTVMCMEPVGVFHAADPEFAAIDATAVSYMYQRGLDNLAAAMLAATTAAALSPDATVDNVLQAALDAAPRTKLRTFYTSSFESAYDYISKCLEIAAKYDDVLAARAELYEKCLLYLHMDPLELWGLSLAMFKIAKGDVRLAAIGGTNIGRDSDTISGRAAMLSGTLRGASNVPVEWVTLFKPEVLAKIKHNAARFANLITTKKLDRMRNRQAVAVPEGN